METQTNIIKSKLNVGYFFLCLGVLVTLITSVVSFLNLVFETLNKRFPDVLNSSYQYGYSTYEYEGIRASLATLIIIFPVYLAVSYFWRKLSNLEMGSLDQMFKKWVIYIILFLSALIVVIDLVTLVRYFISGEVTSRFILKVLTVLIVAGIVGVYYVYLLKGKITQRKMDMVFGSIGLVLVIAAICYSFIIIGSPTKQRLLRLDDRRIGDLQNIQYQIINYWQQKEKLPADLKELANPLSGYSLPVDPEFEKGKQYEYAVKSPLSFELCATFSLPIPKGWREYGGGGVYPMQYPMAYEGKDVSTAYPYPGSGVNESWDHQEGRTCFLRTIDKDMYPPFPKPEKQ